MNQKNVKIVLIQVLLVMVISAAAAFCLYSFIGLWCLAVFGILFVAGGLMIWFPKSGTLGFSVLIFFATLPALLIHNIIDIGLQEFRGLDGFTSLYEDAVAGIPFMPTLAIGILIVTGYLALSYLNSFQKDYQSLVAGEADVYEVEEVTNKSINATGIALGISVIVSAAMVVLLNFLQPVMADYLQDFSWSILLFGLSAVLLLGGLFYFVGIGRRRNVDE